MVPGVSVRSAGVGVRERGEEDIDFTKRQMEEREERDWPQCGTWVVGGDQRKRVDVVACEAHAGNQEGSRRHERDDQSNGRAQQSVESDDKGIFALVHVQVVYVQERRERDGDQESRNDVDHASIGLNFDPKVALRGVHIGDERVHVWGRRPLGHLDPRRLEPDDPADQRAGEEPVSVLLPT